LEKEYEVYGIPFFFKQNGYCKTYYSNGKMKEVLFYKKGKRQGECINYYNNGKLMNRGVYNNDTLISMNVYNEDGTLNSEHFSRSRFVWYQYYKNKSLYQIQYFRPIYRQEEKKPYQFQGDSSITYFYSNSLNKKEKAVSSYNIRDHENNYKATVFFTYNSNGEMVNKDTLMDTKRLGNIIKKVLGKDTVQLEAAISIAQGTEINLLNK